MKSIKYSLLLVLALVSSVSSTVYSQNNLEDSPYIKRESENSVSIPLKKHSVHYNQHGQLITEEAFSDSLKTQRFDISIIHVADTSKISLKNKLSDMDNPKNSADEYRETLKKLMDFSGASATVDDIIPKIMSAFQLNAPKKNNDYWNRFAKNWTQKIENRMLDAYTPIYKKYLTLEELKSIFAFFESPIGQKYKESTLSVMREATPLLVQQLISDMQKEIMPEHSNQIEEIKRRKEQDQKLYDEAYFIPKDSIEVADKIYQRGMDTKPILYSIERRKEDTKVTFLQPIYSNWLWLHYSPGYKIIDKKSGDEYPVKGYAGGAPFGRLLVVKGFNSKYIYVSLLFPKLKKSVKEIDILELPSEKDKLPSNDDGIPKSYFNIKVKDYQVLSKRKPSV